MNRGRRGEAIFTTKEDYWSFVDLLGELDEVFNVKIAAYCLMSIITSLCRPRMQIFPDP
jgi:hypothetical protein